MVAQAMTNLSRSSTSFLKRLMTAVNGPFYFRMSRKGTDLTPPLGKFGLSHK